MNTIDISTKEKKEEIYNLFNSFNKKSDIYEYFNISDNASGVKYINQIAKRIGFDFNIYKEKEKCYCLQCGKQLKKGQKKFCSSSCAAKYNNKGRKISNETKEKIAKSLKNYHESVGHHGNKKTNIKQTTKIKKEKHYCLQCGKELKNNQKKFCSNKCSSDFKKEENINNWLKTGNCGKKCDGTIPQSIKNYLYKINEYKCSICGFEGYNKVTGKTILQIHHIDGDAYNNNINNLQVLCPNHHAMTENFMNLNKGKSTRVNRYKKEE